MKKAIFAILLIPSLLFCELETEPLHSESFQGFLLDEELVKRKYYLTVGTSFLYQKVGAGVRWHHLTTEKGFDLSLNTMILPSIFVPALACVSLDYSYLKYRPAKNGADFRYFGMGVGMGALIQPTLPWINPKISWGTEYESGRFSQWSVNFGPLMWSALAVANRNCGIGGMLGFIAPAIMLEYSFGF